jgi:hypothetical protein
VENRDNYEIDDQEQKAEGSEYSDIPSMPSSHTQVNSTQIEPTGTGCRTLIIFILIISVALGIIYFYKQNQSQNQPTPGNTPPGQTQQ